MASLSLLVTDMCVLFNLFIKSVLQQIVCY